MSDTGGLVERNHRMELQYEGTGLYGWAKQQGLGTVEGCLEDAFRTVLGVAPALRVAGRTDAGVHARRQVVSLLLPDELDLTKLRRSLNALTPAEIAVMDLRRATGTFDARKDATSRSYRYFVCTDPAVSPFWARYCWRLPCGDLDLVAMAEAAALVAGRHDFTAFTPTETDHVFFHRTVLRCRWTRPGGVALSAMALGGAPSAARRRVDDSGRLGSGMLCLEIEADAFLRHMARTLVGTMLEVGRGERTVEGFSRLLSGLPREEAGPTAPPSGLFLWDIRYGRRAAGGAETGTDRPPYGRIPGEADRSGSMSGGDLRDETSDSEA
jgi:tRNA pseudouridine38-40 synthase